jgi:sortase A
VLLLPWAIARTHDTMRRMTRRTPFVALALVLAACSGNDAPTATKADTIPVATTAAPSTTTSTSTPPSVPTTSTTEPVTTSTALEPLGVPTRPPDPHAAEPRVELGAISIPRLNLLAPMFEGVTLTTLNHGPGHWPGSAMPGHRGNVVVAGHRTSHSRPFRHLELLVPGDEVTFIRTEGNYVYTVMATEIVTPDALRIIDQTDNYTATLFACHPVGSTRQRIVVHLALTRRP